MIAVRAAYLDGVVAAVREKLRVPGTKIEKDRRHRELDRTVLPVRVKPPERAAPILGEGVFDGLQCRAAMVVIDRAAIVGIDQAEIPHLGALVDVRHARQGELEHCLSKRVVDAETGDAFGKRQERVEETGPMRVERIGRKALHRVLVGGVRGRPARMELCLAHRFLERALDALGVGSERLCVDRARVEHLRGP